MKVKYDYTLIFDPSDAWTNKYQVDEFLGKALWEAGFIAERVDNYGKGGEILLIKKRLPPAKEKVQPQTDSIKKQVDNVKEKVIKKKK